mmetsp:Transcript_235/g.364  ORF Transcript_235/g.364 Transcript_235/m.364 type:complete len:575 (+) Transcript_235:51-1775(+)
MVFSTNTLVKNDFQSFLTVTAGAAAFVVGLGLSILQLDVVSQKILSQARLQAKRQKEERYRLESSIAASIANVRQHVNSGQYYESAAEVSITELLFSEDEMQTLVDQILDGECGTPIIVGISVDMDSTDFTEWYLRLAFPEKGQENNICDGNIQYVKRVQTPLIKFAKKLAAAFENKLTSTALCFIADASSGLATGVLEELIENCQAGLALVKEPAWMTTLAHISQQKRISQSNLELVLFGLCRLDAWAQRHNSQFGKTVVFTLPGQSCTSNILPALLKVFPCERHVFAYDSCVDSISRAKYLRSKKIQSTYRINSKVSATQQPTSMPRYITATTPISRSLYKIKKLTSNLSKLPHHHADTLQAWMSSVDTFLSLKEKESTNGYMPFVCRMGFLMNQTGRLGNGDTDVSELAMINVLQYITGSRSRPLKEEVLDAAKSTLLDIKNAFDNQQIPEKYNINAQERINIEACVFCHKGILIGDKTLMDTVQPKKEWSLKAAKKLTSCACCMPGYGDEEDDEEQDAELKNGITNMAVPGAFADGISRRAKPKDLINGTGKYVNATSSFAFDPSKFTGI